MRRLTKRVPQSALFGAVALLVAAGGACSDDAGTNTESETTTAALPTGDKSVEIDPASFTTEIDNPYWPMEPGTQWTYREIDADGEELQVVVTVTDATKKIANGVTARVVRDTVTKDGEIIEDTFDWYAQDAAGNIWYFGEDTAEYEDGELASTSGSFEAGVDGAVAGIIMPADPQPGMSYRQEYYKGEAEDNGAVLSVDEKATVPAGQFDDVILTKDTSGLEPDVVEYKLYARGTGLVLTLDASGGSGREELLSVDQVPPGTGTGPLGTAES
jgi:hypothetical protein